MLVFGEGISWAGKTSW